MFDRRLDERDQLRFVAREAPGDKGGAELQSKGDQINRRVGVDGAAPGLGALVGGRRELAFGQPVDPVVLDDVNHVDGAADAVRELSEPDRRRIAVTRDTKINQFTISEVGAGQYRRHTPVDAIEAVRFAEKVGWRL